MRYKKILQRLSIIAFMLFSGFNIYAQESVLLKGKIEAHASDLDKIHVINLNLEKGSVTDKSGNFQIVASESDSLYISSIQFENRTLVVTSEMINDQRIQISLQEDINELAEVMIDDIKLSGYLANDIAKISVSDLETKYKLETNLHSIIRKDREQNPYEKPNMNGGIRLDKLAGTVINKLNNPSDKPKQYSSRELANKSIQLVGQQFFRKELDLRENEICNFVYFCTEDAPRFEELVINSNAFVLIEYFQSRIGEFRERRGAILNAARQIPG
ncbi:carboxypeptidase-like regulatory domain-containing protein [Christiangramia salexigens]|uniref:carboxypeptidase-like regulatory domain-containing protein n=1 Tax=Christiangramia salexigens TaxID=1913577 RepID=UPI0018DDAC3C|nr:carboxypeptidase-like regulatory domain-containing protein [Christiangramia salexigens]